MSPVTLMWLGCAARTSATSVLTMSWRWTRRRWRCQDQALSTRFEKRWRQSSRGSYGRCGSEKCASVNAVMDNDGLYSGSHDDTGTVGARPEFWNGSTGSGLGSAIAGSQQGDRQRGVGGKGGAVRGR